MNLEECSADQLRALRKRLGDAGREQVDREMARRARAILDTSAPRTYVANIVPCAKPRMTQRDRWKQRPAVERYRDFCDRLRAWAEDAHFVAPESGLSMLFLLPMPPSWPRKKREAMHGQPHQQRPDKDNLEKAVWDALLCEDSRVWHTNSVQKRWSHQGAIIFTVTTTDEAL